MRRVNGVRSAVIALLTVVLVGCMTGREFAEELVEPVSVDVESLYGELEEQRSSIETLERLLEFDSSDDRLGRIEDLEDRLDAEHVVADLILEVDPSSATDCSAAVAQTLQDALDCLDGRRIQAGVEVTIELSSGSHPVSSTVHWDHPDGASIQLVGQGTGSGSSVLACSTVAEPCISVVGAADLNLRDLIIDCGGIGSETMGLYAGSGGAIWIGSPGESDESVEIQRCYSGVWVENGASLVTSDNALTIGLGYDGIQVWRNGTVHAPGATITAENGTVSGSRGAVASVPRSTLVGGYAAGGNAGSVIDAEGAVASANTGSRGRNDGFHARYGTIVYAHDATVTGWKYQFFASTNSTITAEGATMNADGVGQYGAFVTVGGVGNFGEGSISNLTGNRTAFLLDNFSVVYANPMTYDGTEVTRFGSTGCSKLKDSANCAE